MAEWPKKRSRTRNFLPGTGVVGSLLLASLAWAGPPAILWQANDGASTVAYSKDGSLIADGGAGVLITIRKAVNGQLVTTIRHKSGINSVAFSPDSTMIADGRTNGSSGNIRIFRVTDGFLINQLAGHNNATRAVVFSNTGTQLISGGDDKTAKVWDVATGALLRTLATANRVRALALSPDGATLATGDLSGGVIVWNLGTGAMIRRLTGPTGSVSGVAFSPNGTYLAASSLDGTARIWRSDTGALVRTISLPGSTPNGSATAVAFSTDSSVLLVGTDEVTPAPEHGALRFYSVANGSLIKIYDKLADVYVSSVAFSPAGHTFAYTRTSDGAVITASNPF